MSKQFKLAELEAAILEAARKDDDCLDELLQEACETMDEERCNRLLDTVLQIMREKLRDLLGWKGDEGKSNGERRI